MYVSRFTRFFLGSVTALMFAFLYSPLVIIVVLSFNTSESLTWPPEGFTLDWWDRALHSEGAREALWTSLRIATAATILALILGTLAAFALQRFAFFGRNSINLFIILPIALPGIVTGIALNAAFLAAAAGTPVTMPLILDSARSEFRKIERPINEADFRWQDPAGAAA